MNIQRILSIVAFIFFAGMVGLEPLAHGETSEEAQSSATYPSPVVIAVTTADGSKTLVKVEPHTWFTNVDYSGPRRHLNIENGKVYLFVINPGYFSAKFSFYPIESFPSVAITKESNTTDMRTVDNQDGYDFGKHPYIAIAVCPANIVNPTRLDCLYPNATKYTIVAPSGAARIFNCMGNSCPLSALINQFNITQAVQSSMTFTSVNQATAVEEIVRITAAFGLAQQQNLADFWRAKKVENDRATADAKVLQAQADAYLHDAKAGTQLFCDSSSYTALAPGQSIADINYICSGLGNQPVRLQHLAEMGWRVVNQSRTPTEGIMGNTVFDVSLVLEKSSGPNAHANK